MQSCKAGDRGQRQERELLGDLETGPERTSRATQIFIWSPHLSRCCFQHDTHPTQSSLRFAFSAGASSLVSASLGTSRCSGVREVDRHGQYNTVWAPGTVLGSSGVETKERKCVLSSCSRSLGEFLVSASEDVVIPLTRAMQQGQKLDESSMGLLSGCWCRILGGDSVGNGLREPSAHRGLGVEPMGDLIKWKEQKVEQGTWVVPAWRE